jgi:hypothetical protein
MQFLWTERRQSAQLLTDYLMITYLTMLSVAQPLYSQMVARFELLFGHLLEGSEDTLKNHQNSRCLGPGLNQGLPDYKAGMVLTRPRRAVCVEILTCPVTQPVKCLCREGYAVLLGHSFFLA